MRSRIILTTLLLLVIAIGFSVYFSNKKSEHLSISEQSFKSKRHIHLATDGTTVEHHHTYEKPNLSKSVVKLRPESDAKHIIQRTWERLDLEAIRQRYQPYSVAEMREMWDKKYLQHCGPFGNFSPGESPIEKADIIYPRNEWLKRALELGHPFVTFSDYRGILNSRKGFIRQREKWAGSVFDYSKDVKFNALHLPPNTTWDEYIDTSLKFTTIGKINLLQAREVDSSIQGGTTSLDGVFLPFKDNTVHVYISPETGMSSFIGAKLTKSEKSDLTNYGIAPEGVTVIYIDENETPLPSGTPIPTFHEEHMKELEQAQTLLQQQIEEHETLLDLDTLLNPSKNGKQTIEVPDEHAHDPEHTHGAPHTHERIPSKQPSQRQHPNARQFPPDLEIPPELHTQDEIDHWFTALEVVHGGKLPRDLQALQEVITELEKIRQEGEVKLKPPERPEPPSSPNSEIQEGSSHSTADEDD